ncbi:MAG TPA: hypothetical protein V6C86_21155 [Oculatellaceae cyanobacterium]
MDECKLTDPESPILVATRMNADANYGEISLLIRIDRLKKSYISTKPAPSMVAAGANNHSTSRRNSYCWSSVRHHLKLSLFLFLEQIDAYKNARKYKDDGNNRRNLHYTRRLLHGTILQTVEQQILVESLAEHQ